MMGVYELDVRIDEEEFTLIGLHCSLEPYRLAYFINKHLGYFLARETLDADVVYKMGRGSFPIYHCQVTDCAINVYLAANKTWVKEKDVASTGLFAQQQSYTKQYFVDDCKSVDYLLKLECDREFIKIKELLSDLNEIPHITSAYELDKNKISKIDHLIFS